VIVEDNKESDDVPTRWCRGKAFNIIRENIMIERFLLGWDKVMVAMAKKNRTKE
jgi:hypothetical protein